MNDYIGKVCPFCKTEFKEGDDIVVCSACEMPHHKECWVENQGCTTFGCLGTIKNANISSSTETTSKVNYEERIPQTDNIIYCTKCGSPNSTSYSFCAKCGNSLTGHETTYTQSIDEDVVKLIGTKKEYYIPKFQEMKTKNDKITWNWPAFLFAPYWFIYRKMYNYGIGVLIAAFIISSIGGPFMNILALCGYIAIGLFANYIYMDHLEKLSAQAKEMKEPFNTQFIANKGGVNGAATVIAIIVYALIIMIFNA